MKQKLITFTLIFISMMLFSVMAVEASPLHDAAEAGDLQKVKQLLNQGADVNAKDKLSQRTPLHLAAFNGNGDIAKLLLSKGAEIGDKNKMLIAASYGGLLWLVHDMLDKGADVNARDTLQNTPLHGAAEAGKTEVAELLIRMGADVNAKNVDGLVHIGFSTPLHEAANAEVAELLIRKGADVNARDRGQGTPLHEAAHQGRTKVAELLIRMGADVNARDKYQDTPLHIAADHDQIEVAELLINNGADVNARDNNQSTPLHYAAKNGKTKVAELLVRKGADVNARNKNQQTPMHYAAETNDANVIELLINHGADVNARDNKQSTPLHWVTGSDSPWGSKTKDAVVLISYGADVNARDNNQSTPLHYAANIGNTEMAELLIANGADATAKDSDGDTPAMIAEKNKYYAKLAAILFAAQSAQGGGGPLHAAALSGDLQKVKQLLGQGADVNTRDMYQQTPLHIAASTGKTKVAELLISQGAEINAQNKDQLTPLHWAAYSGSTKVAKLLIRKGADVNARDKYKDTPLHKAALMGKTEVAELLIRKGADVNTRDMYQQTPLHTAASTGKTAVAELLIAKGANVNAMDKFQQSPFFLAVSYGKIEVAALLIKAGADVNARKGKWTLLDEVASNGNTEMAKLLIKAGADVIDCYSVKCVNAALAEYQKAIETEPLDWRGWARLAQAEKMIGASIHVVAGYYDKALSLIARCKGRIDAVCPRIDSGDYKNILLSDAWLHLRLAHYSHAAKLYAQGLKNNKIEAPAQWGAVARFAAEGLESARAQYHATAEKPTQYDQKGAFEVMLRSGFIQLSNEAEKEGWLWDAYAHVQNIARLEAETNIIQQPKTDTTDKLIELYNELTWWRKARRKSDGTLIPRAQISPAMSSYGQAHAEAARRFAERGKFYKARRNYRLALATDPWWVRGVSELAYVDLMVIGLCDAIPEAENAINLLKQVKIESTSALNIEYPLERSLDKWRKLMGYADENAADSESGYCDPDPDLPNRVMIGPDREILHAPE